MMIFTHILVGMVFAVGIAQLAALPISYFLLAGGIGGLLPDIDLLLTHRKTLHFPLLYAIGTGIFWILYLAVHSDMVLVLIGFMTAATAHSIMDIFGGGKEMRPWRETDERAVYYHLTQQWISPLRMFYDGSVPDLVISIISALVIVSVIPTGMDVVILLLAVMASIYTLLRRVITRWIPEDYATFSSYIQNEIF